MSARLLMNGMKNNCDGVKVESGVWHQDIFFKAPLFWLENPQSLICCPRCRSRQEATKLKGTSISSFSL